MLTETDQALMADKLNMAKAIMRAGSDPTKRSNYTMNYNEDFSNFYKSTDDITGTASGTGNVGDYQNMMELRFMCEKRLGVGYNITHGFAETALFNWFGVKPVDSEKRVPVNGLNKWIMDTDFKNQAILWDAHKRMYGMGLLVKFWKQNEDMRYPAPSTPPRKFSVISPIYLSANNTYETRYIDYDPEMWRFMGGNLKVKSIHPSRIEVIRGKPQQDTYRGLSVIEPIYLPLICYYNSLVYMTRGMGKWGNMTPVIKSGSVTPTPTEYTEFLALMQEFVMNGFFFLGKDDSLEYPTTNISQGLYQMIEIFKEEIAAGTDFPVNRIFGRIESGGIGSQGALTAERQYLNRIANEQVAISDDFLRIFIKSGFDFDGKELDWNLALQRTKDQQLNEEMMQVQLDMLKEQFKSMKLERQMLKQQKDLFEEYKDTFTPDQQITQAKQIEEDFQRANAKYVRTYEEFVKLRAMLSPRGEA